MDPKPRKIGGVKVQPQWNWSDGYATHYRRMMSGKWYVSACFGEIQHFQIGQNWGDQEKRRMELAQKYREFLAARDGVEPDSPQINAIMDRHWRQYYKQPAIEEAAE